MEFIKGLLAGKPLAEIGDFFGGLWANIKGLDVLKSVVDLWDKNIVKYEHFIYLALALVIVLFGQKLMGVMKFVGSFLLGAGLGIKYLAPVIEKIKVPEVAVAAVCGVIAAVLFKIIYIAALVVGAGYVAYDVIVIGAIKPLSQFAGNKIVGAIVAVVAVVLILVFRKFFERLGTAVLGGWIIACQVPALWAGFAKFANGKEAMFKLIIMGVVARVGLIVQLKTRKKY